MCSVCGCGEGEVRIEGAGEVVHAHSHHGHAHADDHHHGAVEAGRVIQLEQDIMAKNNGYAAENRAFFADRGILALNLVSSPGSGKTALLVKTIEMLGAPTKSFVVEGDQQTSNDAERIRATGAPAVQINTGKGCHLDAHMVGHALERLSPDQGSLVFIENVGNLVCPAGFDLGEAHKVLVLSVTEGDDKPLKYPDMFAVADLVLINKIDLLPHVDFDMNAVAANARRINPGVKLLKLSARTGEGIGDWIAWIGAARAMALVGHPLGTAAE